MIGDIDVDLKELNTLIDNSVEIRDHLLSVKANREPVRKFSIAEPRVSEHAVLRYMERVMGLNIDAIRSEILTEARKMVIASGARLIKAGPVRFIVMNGTVITVLREEK